MNTSLAVAVLLIAFAPWLIGWGLWLVLAIAGAWPLPHQQRRLRRPGPIDVLIPAHDEQTLLPKLLRSLHTQTRRDLLRHIVVVADHCSDRTAELARAAGAVVLERHTGPHGKPAALRDGLAHLKELDPVPGHVLILDADCVCAPDCIAALAAEISLRHKVLQAGYLLTPAGGDLDGSLQLGLQLKNILRPSGLRRLGLPCQLFGTGMLFHASLRRTLSFEDHLVEDVRLSHELLVRGIAPRFVPAARVTSPLPADDAALTTQRLRWEGGQAQTWRRLPALVLKLIGRGRCKALLALVDWSAPPTSVGVLGWILLSLLALGLVLAHLLPELALAVPAFAGLLFAAYLAVGVIATQGLGQLGRLLGNVPHFIAWKAGIYGHLARGDTPRDWQRTPRMEAAER